MKKKISLIFIIFIIFSVTTYAEEEMLENIEIIGENEEISENIETIGDQIGEKISDIEENQEEIKIIEQDELSQNSLYSGTMYIDTPTNNENFEVINTKNIKITGWAVSNDKNVSLKLYINNWLWAEIYDRTIRGDVSNISTNYGGTATTPKAGFSKNLDVSGFESGTYTIRIDQVASNGQLISTDARTIKLGQKQYKGAMYIDTPTNNSRYIVSDTNYIDVSGWAVSDDSNVSLKLYINNWLWAEIYDRTIRGDVNNISENYGGTATTPKAGFSKNLDVSGFESGTYTIRIDQVAKNGKIICSDSRNINIDKKNFFGLIYVDTPTNNSKFNLSDQRYINITGWAVSNDKNSYILVSNNGKMAKYILDRTDRDDVNNIISSSYGGTECTPKAGFSIVLDISDLKEGNNIIDVMEVSSEHQILSRRQIVVNISTPNYDGMMNIDSPTHNKRYPSGWLEVRGWALTDAPGDYVEIYLDNKYIGLAPREKRNDVFRVYPDMYGLNSDSTPGFYAQINTSNLQEGKHVIKAIHYSGYGKQIQTRETQFIISNTLTWGIDVSHHNGTIDWNAVKNQGINFAILKIGEYRESSGRIIPDDHFEQYYSECKRLGIAVGGYFYSYAFDPNEATNEANACVSIINGKTFEMPIFIDIEDDIVKRAVDSGRTNVDNLTNGAITFCNIMNSRGYQGGVYANKLFYTKYLNTVFLENHSIWLAHYTSNTDYTGKYDMWQYTSSGTMNGINGNVDLNWCFRRYY